MGDMTVTSSGTPLEDHLARQRGHDLVWLRDRWEDVEFTWGDDGLTARDGTRVLRAGSAGELDAFLRAR
jgi:hypothetical protein